MMEIYKNGDTIDVDIVNRKLCDVRCEYCLVLSLTCARCKKYKKELNSKGERCQECITEFGMGE